MKVALIAAFAAILASVDAPVAHALSRPEFKPPALFDCDTFPGGGRVCSDTPNKDWSYIDRGAWKEAWPYLKRASDEAIRGRGFSFKLKCGPYSGQNCRTQTRALLVNPTHQSIWQVHREPCTRPSMGLRCIVVRFGNECIGQSIEMATRTKPVRRLKWMEVGIYVCPSDPAPPPPETAPGA